MNKMAFINRRLFMLQLCSKVACCLVESGYLADDDNAENSIMTLVNFFENGVDLPDYSFDFNVIDKCDKKKYIA